MIWELPKSLTVGEKEWKIRTDYRDILNILAAFDDPDLDIQEKELVCLCVLYEDFEGMDREDYPEAYKQAVKFIDNGAESKGGPRTMDWEQDARILFPAINHAAGMEVRAQEYLHWHTFLGYFMEIKDSVYSTVLGIRQKKAKGKKLEKWEKDFWSANKDICILKTRLTEEETEEKERLKAILG